MLEVSATQSTLVYCTIYTTTNVPVDQLTQDNCRISASVSVCSSGFIVAVRATVRGILIGLRLVYICYSEIGQFADNKLDLLAFN